MISSKPEDFKEGPGTGEKLQAWPSAQLAEQFHGSGRGGSRLQLLEAESVFQQSQRAMLPSCER